MSSLAHISAVPSDAQGFRYAAAAAGVAQMFDQSIAGCGRAFAEMIQVSSELKLEAGITQPVLASTLAAMTSLVEGRAAMDKSRRMARGIAQKAGVELAWGDLGCPMPSEG